MASFPLHQKKNVSALCLEYIKVLSEINFGENLDKQVQLLYGVCDGETHSSAFFNEHGQIYKMTDNTFNNNKPMLCLPDSPHKINKIRNFIISENPISSIMALKSICHTCWMQLSVVGPKYH